MKLDHWNSFVLTDLGEWADTIQQPVVELHLCEYHCRVNSYKLNTKGLIFILDIWICNLLTNLKR